MWCGAGSVLVVALPMCVSSVAGGAVFVGAVCGVIYWALPCSVLPRSCRHLHVALACLRLWWLSCGVPYKGVQVLLSARGRGPLHVCASVVYHGVWVWSCVSYRRLSTPGGTMARRDSPSLPKCRTLSKRGGSSCGASLALHRPPLRPPPATTFECRRPSDRHFSVDLPMSSAWTPFGMTANHASLDTCRDIAHAPQAIGARSRAQRAPQPCLKVSCCGRWQRATPWDRVLCRQSPCCPGTLAGHSKERSQVPMDLNENASSHFLTCALSPPRRTQMAEEGQAGPLLLPPSCDTSSPANLRMASLQASVYACCARQVPLPMPPRTRTSRRSRAHRRPRERYRRPPQTSRSVNGTLKACMNKVVAARSMHFCARHLCTISSHAPGNSVWNSVSTSLYI